MNRINNQSNVQLTHSNIGMGETHYGNWNRYCNPNSGYVANSIYFMSEPRFEYYAFFRFLPSVRSYYKVLKAIDKLRVGSLITDTKTMKAMGENVLNKQDEGFKEIVALLRRNYPIPKKAVIEGIKYWESVYLNKPSPFGLHLKCLNVTIDGRDEFPFGATNSLYELKQMADRFVREKITTFIVLLASIVTMLSVSLIVYVNLDI